MTIPTDSTAGRSIEQDGRGEQAKQGGQDAQTTMAELAMAYAKERQYDEALRYFQKIEIRLSPEARSYYGLALAMRRPQLEDAVRYCREAVDQDPLRGDLYYNLGQVYLACGEKQRAVRAFLQGLEAQPRHTRLAEAVKSLGVRQRPAVPVLHRANPVNKCLGWVRHRITARMKRAV